MEMRTSGTILWMISQTDFSSYPIGLGMGRGAAAISKLSTGKVQFLAGEYEFMREMIEFGPFLGIAFSIFRFLLALTIMWSAVKSARRQEPLALLLVSTLLAALGFGTLEQPTDQGFMVICVGFSLAAIRTSVIAVAPGRMRGAALWGPTSLDGLARARFSRGNFRQQ